MASDEEMDFAVQWEETVSQLYDLALTGTSKKRGGFIPVSAKLAARVLAEMRTDVTGYHHIVDTDSIRHIQKEHGGIREILRGQVPIVRTDVLRLRLVMTEPDTLILAEAGRHGLTRIEMTKALLGYSYTCIVELQRGRKWIVPVTFYKRSGLQVFSVV